MAEKSRRAAKVTPENKEEARLLKELWDSREHPTQAVFGETYGIGNQSAVGQFLRGDVPLSLKAALGFAQGLNVRLQDFSPRLAAEAEEIAKMAPGKPLKPEVAALAFAINELKPKQLAAVLKQVRDTLQIISDLTDAASNAKDSSAQEAASSKRVRVRR